MDPAPGPRQLELRRRRPPPTTRWSWIVVGALVAAAAGGCSSAPQQKVNPVIRVLASWTGSELDTFNAVVARFEEQTGFRVEYTASRDLRGELQREVAAGRPPDLAGLAGPPHMTELARAGLLKGLADAIDLRAYKASVAPTFIDLGTVDGRLVGIFIRSTVKGLIWFNPTVHAHEPPATWAELELMLVQMGETRPWCLGLGSRESSGWPGTDWIENFLIRQTGEDVYDEWVAGRLPWTSSEVTRAWKSYGKVVSNQTVFGGARGAIETDFAAAGDPLFTTPPGCLFLQQGSFMPSFWQEQARAPGRDFDFFPFPEIDPDHHGAVIGAGDLFGLLTDSSAARQLIAYLVSPEAQTTWVAAGGVLSVVRNVTDYPDPIAAKAAAMLTEADQFRFDGSDLMPVELGTAFWQGVLDYTADQSRLSAILGDLEATRERIHGQ